MPLESLRPDARPNVKNLSPEIPEKELGQAEQLMVDLKETILYIPEFDYWAEVMTAHQEIYEEMAYLCKLREQLIAIIAEYQFSPRIALEKYSILKNNPLFHGKIYEAYFKRYEEEEMGFEDKIINLYVESLFNINESREKFERKKSKFFDSQKNLWFYPDNFNPEEDDYASTDPLLYILIQSRFDKNAAHEQFEALKESEAYDKKNSVWHPQLGVEGEIACYEQLLAILVEAQFDKENARNLFNELKKTDLYDPKLKQWEGLAGDLVDSSRSAKNQLLGVIIEKILEPESEEEETPRPEKRNY